MKKLEVYVDNYNKLVVSEFKSVDSKYESKILKEKEAYEYLKKYSASKIIDLYINEKQEEIILDYKNCTVVLNEYTKLFEKRYLSYLARDIKNFEEQKRVRNLKNRKVKRTNKFNGKVILITTLALILLYIGAENVFGMHKIDGESDQTYSSSYFYGSLEEIQPYLESSSINQTVFSSSSSNKETISSESNVQKNDMSVSEESNNHAINAISIDYEDKSLEEKAYITKAYYGKLLTKYAKIYGIDPTLAIAVATQESGVHSSKINPTRGTGLMQIETPVWLNQQVTAYNFETKTKETLTVTSERIQNVEYNIKIGCMILQNSLEYMNYNTLAGLQCYNMGVGNMTNILKEYSLDCGKSVDEILNDHNDVEWLKYRDIVGAGDDLYVEHVLSWIGDQVNFKNAKKDGTLIEINVNNNITTKKVY